MSHAQKERRYAAAIKRFAAKNWLFLVIAGILCLYLLGRAFPQKVDTNSTNDTTVQTEVIQQVPEEDTLHWRFYPVDLWVLGIGGGFCTIMIIREKRKARETLK